MAEAAHDPAQFTITRFGRRRRRGTWGVIMTVAMLACMPAVRALRRVLGRDSGS